MADEEDSLNKKFKFDMINQVKSFLSRIEKEYKEKQSEKFKEKLSFLEKSSYKEIRKSYEEEIKRFTILALEVATIVGVLFILVFGLAIGRYYKLQIALQVLHSAFKILGPVLLIGILSVALFFFLLSKLDSILFDYYINRRILTTEKLRNVFFLCLQKYLIVSTLE